MGTVEDAIKPYLFLDVDGVINVFPPNKNYKNGKHLKFWDDWEKKEFVFEESTYPFFYSPSVITELSRLREHYEIVWLTTWQNLANTMLSKLVETDILTASFIERTDFMKENSSSIFATGKRTWWKILSLDTFISSNAKDFLWLDDEYSKDIRKEVERIAFMNDVTGKILPIYEGRGIVPHDIEIMINYAHSLKALRE